MNKHTKIILAFCPVFIAACSDKHHTYDAAGSFEAKEIIISSEASGKIISFHVQEGDAIGIGDTIANIDVSHLKLQGEQIEAKLHAIQHKISDADPAVQVLIKQLAAANAKVDATQTRLDVLMKEEQRTNKLLLAEAATAQQMDEISGKVKVLEKELTASRKQAEVLSTQIESSKRTVSLQNRAILSELEPVEKQLKILDNQINKAIILSPIKGTILIRFAEPGELTSMGKPLVKIADLSDMEFTGYISGDQLPEVEIGQSVQVYIDQGKKEYKVYPGKISRISNQAEFTPKNIQTKNERANLVYAIKALVKNDGAIKIGMYGELSLTVQESANE